MTDSVAWRLTAPLRRLTAYRRAGLTQSFADGGEGERMRRVPTVLGRRLSGSYPFRRRAR